MARKTTVATASSAATIFKAIDDKLWQPGSGCSGALDYMEQSSWLLFLRYLDAREEERKLDAEMVGNQYEPALPEELRWSTWAYPQKPDGSLDIDRVPKGDDLILFVHNKLFPGLRSLKASARGTDSIQYRIGSIFEQLNCRFTDGFLLREVIELMQPLNDGTRGGKREKAGRGWNTGNSADGIGGSGVGKYGWV